MEKIIQHAGVALIVTGAVILALTQIAALSGSNALLLTGLLLIVAGLWLHIRSIKKDSLY